MKIGCIRQKHMLYEVQYIDLFGQLICRVVVWLIIGNRGLLASWVFTLPYILGIIIIISIITTTSQAATLVGKSWDDAKGPTKESSLARERRMSYKTNITKSKQAMKCHMLACSAKSICSKIKQNICTKLKLITSNSTWLIKSFHRRN